MSHPSRPVRGFLRGEVPSSHQGGLGAQVTSLDPVCHQVDILENWCLRELGRGRGAPPPTIPALNKHPPW